MVKVSVVIPLYNKAHHVERALRSVLAQTFQDFEVIVVDDGSTDNGSEIVKGILDARIRLIQQENAGVSAARNRGIKEANADLIAFLDADDVWDNKYLKHIEFLTYQYPKCEAFACRWAFKSGNKIKKPRIKNIPTQHGILKNYIKSIANGESPLCTSSIVIKKRVFSIAGLFNTNFNMGEDIDMWYRLSKKAEIAFFNKTLAYYNIDADNRLCKRFTPEGDLPFYDMLREDIRNAYSYSQKYYLKKILAKNIHNIAKNNIKQGNIAVATKLFQQGPLIFNQETLKCLIWYIFYMLTLATNLK